MFRNKYDAPLSFTKGYFLLEAIQNIISFVKVGSIIDISCTHGHLKHYEII